MIRYLRRLIRKLLRRPPDSRTAIQRWLDKPDRKW